MVNERKKITNARYYEANKERLKKLNMDKYNENKDIILQRKKNVITLRNSSQTFQFY